MKKTNSILKVLFAGTLLLSAISCKYELVPAPSGIGGNGSSDLSETIDPPTNLVVSQGNYRSIELNWKSTKNAVQYQIFSALTPYDTFVQEGETAGKETTFTIDETSGITKYYMVKAVNYYGKASRGSKIVAGTTLDVPIITEISASEEGTCLEVHWWMGNCSESTYANNIQYTVYAYNANKTKIPDIQAVVPGTETQCVVNGLTPKTDYWFTVEAKKIDSEQKSEISDLTNAQTAHKVIPAAVENFSATKGSNKNQVEISWSLPDSVDYYDKSTRLYSSHPVYFKLQRKLLGEDDKSYQTLESYIGCGTTSGLKFNCKNNSTSNATKLKVEGNAEGEPNELNQAYIPGSVITYIDKTAAIGKQYTYRIQSFTDYASSEITSDNSILTTDGWKLSDPTFKAESTMTTEGTTITSVSVGFSLSFNDFASYFEEKEIKYPYNYVITYQKTTFDSIKSDEAVLYKLNTREEVLSTVKTISNPENEDVQGYYTFKLYIINATADETVSVPAEYLAYTTSANIVAITDDATLIPEIKNFKIRDGFKDKFILSWDHVADATYTLSWTNYSNGVAVSEDSKVLAPAEYALSGNTVTYTHTAESGDSRQYTLNITKAGIPDTKEYEEMSKTLGTAVPEMSAPDYKTITVTWPKVQMADTQYTITANYENGATVLADNYEITEDETTGIVTCVISEPTGYNNISKAGLPINFKVTAKNTSTNDTTVSEVLTTRTLGPALIGTKVSTEITAKTLSVSWNPVEGATGYIIYRTKHAYNETKKAFTFDRADYYYYSTADGKLKESGNDVPSIRAKVAMKNDVYTLTDYDADASDDTSSYEKNQSQISWGIPFGYVVLPVKGDVNDFSFGADSNYLKVTGGKADVIYTSALNEQKTATFGYGLNVTAAKSESASAVKVTWAKPYNANLIPTIYKMPFDKEENHDYSSSWTLVKELAAGATSYEDVLDVNDIASAFVYAVQYQAPRTSNFTESYRENLATSKENTETKNKGYLLTLKDFEAVYGGTGTSAGDASYYQENVTWDKVWDYKERAIGPDSFTIDILNKNVASTKDWATVANVTVNNGTQTLNPVTTYTDTIITKMQSNDGIYLKPKGLSEGTSQITNDLLKVLRDAKHYYSVKLTRGDISVRQANFEDSNGYEIYALRQISPEELAKSALLVNADAFYGTTNTKQESSIVYVYTEYTHNTSGKEGSFFWKNGYDQITFQYDKYVHIFTSTPYGKDIVSFLKFSDCNYSEKGNWNNNKSYNLRTFCSEKTSTPSSSNLVKITLSSNLGFSSYEGKIGFSCTDSKLYLRLYNTEGKEILSKDITDSTTLKTWNPMRIAGNDYTGLSGNYWWN